MIHSKIQRLIVFKNFVEDLATLSKCTDKKVASIIFSKDATQIYSIGINGGPKGGPDCLCTLGGKYTCAHAEANAIAKCHTNNNDKAMLCTLAPCITCATLIVNSGIKTVYYIKPYHDITGIKLLIAAGIDVIHLDKDFYTEKVMSEFDVREEI